MNACNMYFGHSHGVYLLIMEGVSVSQCITHSMLKFSPCCAIVTIVDLSSVFSMILCLQIVVMNE